MHRITLELSDDEIAALEMLIYDGQLSFGQTLQKYKDVHDNASIEFWTSLVDNTNSLNDKVLEVMEEVYPERKKPPLRTGRL